MDKRSQLRSRAIAIAAAFIAASAPLAMAQEGAMAVPVFDLDAIGGQALTEDELACLEGGDVVVTLNPERTIITVSVYEEDDRGRRRLREVRSFPAHNRVQDAIGATYMPADGYEAYTDFVSGDLIRTRPRQFPNGTWRITTLNPRSDRFGPWMIGTDAVGNVPVYKNGLYEGFFADRGYAVHANSRDFNTSVSWGCVIVPEDAVRYLVTRIGEDRRAGCDDQFIYIAPIRRL